MVSVSEPTLSFMIEARLSGISATLALLIPWSAIAPVADQFAARDDARARAATRTRPPCAAPSATSR